MRYGMKYSARGLAVVAGGLLAAGMVMPAPTARAGVMIDCASSYMDGSLFHINCYNPDSAPGKVDVMYVCSTPLDFERQIVFNEPGNYVGGNSWLRLTRDCGAEQRVISYSLWPLTQDQQSDQSDRQATIRAERDRQTPR